MPIYEYRCEHCGDFEETQRISDSPLQRCPKCRRKVRRLISSTSFQLKGGGWYVTDYARGGSSNGGTKGESKNESKSESRSGSQSDSTSGNGPSDTKSASKTESKAESKPASGGTTEKSSS